MTEGRREPLVSIVIPVFNGSRYLSDAIDSALEQTYANTEIVVVNDGSNDGGATEAVATSYGDRIRYFTKPNGGVASALNEAIRAARGEYISWLSHDDVYKPTKVAAQIAFLAERRFSVNTVVYTHEDFIGAQGQTLRRGRSRETLRYALPFELLRSRFIGGCTLLLPRRLFDRVGWFDESLRTVQDYDLWFRALRHGYEFAYLPLALVMTRIHESQTSQLLREIHRREKDRLLENAISLFRPSQLVPGRVRGMRVFSLLGLSYSRQRLHRASAKAFSVGFGLMMPKAAAEILGGILRDACRLGYRKESRATRDQILRVQ